jgi:hypothetical protein
MTVSSNVYDFTVTAANPMTYVNVARYAFVTVPYNFVQRFIREQIFADPNTKFSAAEMQDCVNLINGGNTAISLDRGSYQRNCTSRRIFVEVEVNGNTVTMEALQMRTNFENGGVPHRVLRLGGNVENLTIASASMFPFFSSFCKIHPSGNKNLEMTQPSFHDMKKDGEPWKPNTAQEYADLMFAFKKKINDWGEIHSMLCFSMGSMALEGLENRDPQEVPKNLIIHNGCPSIWKVGVKTQNFVIARLLYWSAWVTGWGGDPEHSVKEFYNRNVERRTFVNMRAKHDAYFSDQGYWDAFGDKNVCDHTVRMNRIVSHERSHHAATPDSMINTDGPIQGGSFAMGAWQSFADALASSLFSTQ